MPEIYKPGPIEGHNIQTSEMVGAINTELKCLLLGVVATGSFISETEIHSRIMVYSAGEKLRPVRRNVLGDILSRMPDQIIDVKFEEDANERYFARTRCGETAAAVGGHFLDYSSRYAQPLRMVFGERRKPDGPGGRQHVGISPIDTRLAILSTLPVAPEGAWMTTNEVADLASSPELPIRHELAHRHLRRLLATTLIDAEIIGREFLVRIAEHNGYFDPREAILSYLTAIENVRADDKLAHDEGLIKVQAVLANNNGLIPLLVQRSYTSTAHTGKSTKHH